MTTRRIEELDGLRAFAVLFVLLYHLAIFSEKLPPFPAWFGNAALVLGASGVNVFFTISGFVITLLLLRERAQTGAVDLRAFYVRRAFRLLPALLAYVAVVFLMRSLHLVGTSYRNFPIALCFLGNFNLFDGKSWLLAHTWSLSVEEQYYAIFPLALTRLFRFRTNLATGWLVGIYVPLGLLAPYDIHRAPHGAEGSIVMGLAHFRYIIVGVLLALHRERAEKLLVGSSRLVPIACAAAIFGASFWRDAPLWFSGMAGLIVPALFGPLALWFPANPKHSALLRCRPIQWIGLSSYSIYLWQQLFTASAGNHRGSVLGSLPASLVGLGVFATLSYFLVERLGIRWGRAIEAKL